jgi:quercetin dioxygenase-like cupin family protein
MIHQKILEELDKNIVSTFQETSGGVVSFLNTVVENLHVATIKPGAVRANHKYIHDEVICIMGGEGLCEIEVEDSRVGTKERVQIDENLKTYQIKAGVKHAVYNVGENEFYLVSFLTVRKDKLPKTPKMPVEKHFIEIMEDSLEYVLETYDWEGWCPMTDNGITVSGFWDKSKGIPDTDEYELDERGVYVKKGTVKGV